MKRIESFFKANMNGEFDGNPQKDCRFVKHIGQRTLREITSQGAS